MRTQRFIFLSATIACFVLSSQATQCFYPNGKTTEPDHVPCNSTLSASACCGPLDTCTTSGICLGSTGFNYRGSCTDSTWASANCPADCRVDPFSKQPYSTFTPLWSCDKPGGPSTNFCCNSPNRNCCAIAKFPYGSTGSSFNPGMDHLLEELATSSKPAQATAKVTVTVTGDPASQTGDPATQTATVSQSVNDITNKQSSSSSSGATMGAAIGVPLGLLSLGLLGLLFWRERRHGQAAAETRAKVLEMQKVRPQYYTPGPPPRPPRLDATALKAESDDFGRLAYTSNSSGYTGGIAAMKEMI